MEITPGYHYRSNKNTLWGRCFITLSILAPHLFVLGWVKFDFIVRGRLVETGLGRWTLLVTVISVDPYPFLAFSDLTCHLEDTEIAKCVLVVLCSILARRHNLEVATKRLLHQPGKKTEVVLVPYHTWTCYFWWCGYFQVPWLSFVTTDEFSVGSQNYFKDWWLMNSQARYFSVFELFLTQWIATIILSKGCKSDNFESHNSLKLSLTNVWGWGLHFRFPLLITFSSLVYALLFMLFHKMGCYISLHTL